MSKLAQVVITYIGVCKQYHFMYFALAYLSIFFLLFFVGPSKQIFFSEPRRLLSMDHHMAIVFILS